MEGGGSVASILNCVDHLALLLLVGDCGGVTDPGGGGPGVGRCRGGRTPHAQVRLASA